MHFSSLRAACTVLLSALFGLALFAAPAGVAFATAFNITAPATGITSGDATLNGVNGAVAADDHSFWVSTSTFSTAVPSMPDGVYSSPTLGALGANDPFSTSLSSITTAGIPANLPAITPNTTYYFAAWTDIGGTWIPGDVLSFTTLAVHTLTYTAGTGGSITGTSPQTVDDGASGAAVTAVANSGYHFTSWSDGVLTASRTDSGVTGDISVTANFASNDIYVDPAGNDANDGSSGSPVLTISHAISIVPTGGTIHVATGLYNEQVQITKTLTLLGSQAGVDARTRSGAESVIDNACGPVQIMANNVTIDGFTIQGSTASDPCFLAGIWTNPGYSGTDGGHQIVNNIIQNNISGIELDNIGTYATKVQYNLIQNNNESGPGSGNGLQVNFGLSNALIDNNAFVNNQNGSVGVFAAGSGNTVSNNTMDSQIYLYAQTGGGQVTNNIITNSSSGGISLDSNSGLTVTNNEVNGVASGYSALRLRNDVGTQNSGLTVTNNQFNAGVSGYGVRPMAGSYSGILTLSDNQITGGTAAIQNDDVALTIHASGNAWGSTVGATIASMILGDGSALVTYRPWCLGYDTSGNTCSPALDTVIPTVSTVSVTPDPTVGGEVSITVTFSEAMNTAIAPTITVTGLSGGTLTVSGTFTDSTTWQGTVTVPDNDEEVPAAAVSVAGAEDPSGNQLVTDTAHTFTVDTLAPVISTIDSDATGAGWLEIGDTINFVLTPNKIEPGASVTGSYNGHALSWTEAGGGATYTATYTVADGDNDQVSALQIAGVTITDSAGNVSASASGADVAKKIDAHTPVITAYTISELDFSPDASPGVKDTTSIDTDFNETSTYSIDIKDSTLTTVRHWGGTTINPNPRIWDGADSVGDQVPEGVYAIVVTATDAAGNSVTDSSQTIVVDNTAPVIALTGLNPQTLEVHSPYSDLGSNVTDNVDLALVATVDSSALNVNTVGSYTVHYDVSDTAGNPAVQADRTVNVVDTTIPTIELNGSDPETVEVYTSYADAGAVAHDNYDADTPVSTPDPVDVNTLGGYTLHYNHTDANGNAAVEVTRTVNVVDTTAPVITLTGSADMTIEALGGYTDDGATANDNYDGDLTISINTIDTVNPNVIGDYTVTYDVTDGNGNSATTVTRTVHVRDTTKPSITMTGSTPVTVEVHGPYVDAGATASDNYDGDVTGSIVTTNPVDVDTVGNYTVRYNVQDVSANAADEVTRTVNVVDTTLPVITLSGSADLDVQAGSTYSDAGATASDNYDGNITENIVTVNPVNTSILGDYAVTYNVTDSNGNAAAQVTRTVHVIDTTAPVIMLIGTDPLSVVLGDTFTDPGATTSDNYDADTVITASDAPDTATVGNYTLHYNHTDSNGNAATQVTRTVHVSSTELVVIPGTPDGDGNSTGTLTHAATSTVGSMTVEIPADTDVTGGAGWDGTITLPTVSTSYTSPTPDSGTTVTVTLALEVGSSTSALTFDKGVRILFAGQSGSRVGWSRNGVFTEITNTCTPNDSQATGDALAAGADCKIVVGSDLVVWTKHFTTFLTYTQNTIPVTSSGGGGGGGNGAPVGSLGVSGSVIPTLASAGTGTGTGTGFGGEVLGATAFNFAKNLRFGMHNTDVAELQKFLVAAGYSIPHAVTNYFGSETLVAVKAFQKAHGIPTTGFVGPLTRAALNN